MGRLGMLWMLITVWTSTMLLTACANQEAELSVKSGEILQMGVSEEQPKAGRLDLNGDGRKESLYLEGFSDNSLDTGYARWQNGDAYLNDRYRIRVNRTSSESGYCNILHPVLMAFSPDGETILLAVFDEGPSDDPVTSFFLYDGKSVHTAGSIPGDLRTAEVTDGVIRCSFRGDMLQTQRAWGYYYWDGNEIVKRQDAVYEYLDESEWRKEVPLLLIKEITVYEDRSEKSIALQMRPQEVQCTATDLKEWVLLEAEDGTKGWIRVDGFALPSEGNAKVHEVFQGLNMAD